MFVISVAFPLSGLSVTVCVVMWGEVLVVQVISSCGEGPGGRERERDREMD